VKVEEKPGFKPKQSHIDIINNVQKGTLPIHTSVIEEGVMDENGLKYKKAYD
jgi:hypothetical protein